MIRRNATPLRMALLTVVSLSIGACANDGLAAPQGAAPLRSFGASLSRNPLPANDREKRPLVTTLRAKPKSPVLFVTDAGTGEAYMFDTATLALIGTITGFVQPQGECADSKGNVWIADSAARTVYE